MHGLFSFLTDYYTLVVIIVIFSGFGLMLMLVYLVQNKKPHKYSKFIVTVFVTAFGYHIYYFKVVQLQFEIFYDDINNVELYLNDKLVKNKLEVLNALREIRMRKNRPAGSHPEKSNALKIVHKESEYEFLLQEDSRNPTSYWLTTPQTRSVSEIGFVDVSKFNF
jgi:hypothetical protein